MKIKWTGESQSITIRDQVFTKGRAVDVKNEDLAQKVLGIEGFVAVKGKPKDGDKG